MVTYIPMAVKFACNVEGPELMSSEAAAVYSALQLGLDVNFDMRALHALRCTGRLAEEVHACNSCDVALAWLANVG